jgi:hypothetical protein
LRLQLWLHELILVKSDYPKIIIPIRIMVSITPVFWVWLKDRNSHWNFLLKRKQIKKLKLKIFFSVSRKTEKWVKYWKKAEKKLFFCLKKTKNVNKKLKTFTESWKLSLKIVSGSIKKPFLQINHFFLIRYALANYVKIIKKFHFMIFIVIVLSYDRLAIGYMIDDVIVIELRKITHLWFNETKTDIFFIF